jgi:hypothetical protein
MFLQIKWTFLSGKMDFQETEGMQTEEPRAKPPQLEVKGPSPGNPFAGLLNAIAVIASGVLAGLLGTSQREKKALQSTISAVCIYQPLGNISSPLAPSNILHAHNKIVC